MSPRYRSLLAGLLVVLLGAAIVVFQLNRPLPMLPARQVVAADQQVTGERPKVPWPTGGIAAIGATELGLIDVSPGERPLPIASVAKVMTADVVLADHPLRPQESGPMLTITAADVASYQQKKAAGESVLEVEAGEQLSELQALQAILIPSANNIAEFLAVWDAGSVQAFVVKMNGTAKQLGMRQTTFTDPSGLDENTKSTPSDLTRLAGAAIADPVLAGLVATPNAVLPVAGTVYNVDYDLGQGGIDGIKTGSTPAAGACFMFSSAFRIAGHTLKVVGAVMALPTLDDAFAAAKRLIDFLKQGLVYDQALHPGQAVAEYDAPWGQRSVLRATDGVYLLEWPGMKVQRLLHVAATPVPLRSGARRGSLEVRLGDQDFRVPLQTDGEITPPGKGWRLTRLG